MKISSKLKEELLYYADYYNHPRFIEQDPIQIPHLFTKKQDIEIAGFWTAILSWGNRTTIIKKSKELMCLLEQSPHEFILNHSEKDRTRFEHFVQRTFQYTDSLYFLEFLQHWYKNHDSLESAFGLENQKAQTHIEQNLIHFHNCFFSLPDVPERTKKHISTPISGSRCKRLIMFLRWMVRNDKSGVDFGIWSTISPKQLLLPLDVHVERMARQLNLLQRKALDWKAVLELGQNCSMILPEDPAKLDFALFGLSLEQKKKSQF
ncbi:MAG TPA: TIGR02757 family protein [Saprospiraceae bacterium]|nr:TIGR02757 family protein [Saprospiraceae bacterium]